LRLLTGLRHQAFASPAPQLQTVEVYFTVCMVRV